MNAPFAGAPRAATDRHEHMAMFLLLVVVFINIAGFGIVIPLLPFYAQSFRVEPWQVTALFSAYSIGQFFGEPFWGRLSDRIGRRPVLIGTILATGIGYVLLAFAGSIGVAFVLRLIGGFAAGNIATIQGYVADITPPERRVARLGLIGSAFGLGFVVGPAIGGLLARPELGEAGFRPPLFAAAGLGFAAALGILLFVRESRSAEVRALQVPSRRLAVLSDAWESPVVRRVLLSTLVATGAFSAMEAIFGLWGEARFGWGPREIGLIFGFIGLLSALTQGLLAGWVVKRLGEAVTLALGLAITSVSLVLQALSPYGWLVVAVTTFTVIGISITNPSIAGLISRASRPEHQGAILGVNGAASAFARIIGPVIAGFLFSGFGVNAPYYFAAIAIIPAVFLALKAGRAMRTLDHLA